MTLSTPWSYNAQEKNWITGVSYHTQKKGNHKQTTRAWRMHKSTRLTIICEPHTWISNRKCHSMLRIELRIANSFESRLTDPYWWINNAKASLDQMEKQTRCCKCFLLAGGQGERGAPAPYIEKGKIGSRRCYIEKDKTEPFSIATTRV